MSRRALTAAVLPLLVILAGCAGDTKPATNVQAHQAQLNATGHTNNGPAYWWWEYGISRTAVAGGTGTKTPRQGPASSPDDVNLNTVVKNLDAGQVYYFRACGQDQAAGSSATCGHVTSFTTPLNDSTIDNNGSTATYVANQANAHSVSISAGTIHGPRVSVQERGVPEEGGAASDLTSPSGTCTLLSTALGFNDTGHCAYSGHPAISAKLSPYDDVMNATMSDPSGSFTANLGDGNDVATGPAAYSVIHGGNGDDTITGVGWLAGDDGNDVLTTTPGAAGTLGSTLLEGDGGEDTLTGNDNTDHYQAGDGNDTLYYSHGTDSMNCGPGDDLVVVGVKPTDTDNTTFDSSCESFEITWCEPFCPAPSPAKEGATAWHPGEPGMITAAGIRALPSARR